MPGWQDFDRIQAERPVASQPLAHAATDDIQLLNRQASAAQQTEFSCLTDNIQSLNRRHSAAKQTRMVKRKLFIHASTSADAWMKVTSGIAEYFTPGVSDDIQLQTQ